ncbi:hypothetical protein AUEXF2481DRAFT_454699 [Aureobasidium subglaciale EXF-2481]|uniref:Uncharacterized protein n=1 Tax=Aureobasidium subglaciale (strain EXF-2481) TaxID=1043005 RepID=A0A074Y776_AURSE|nr:uncharacterized protein AUEXF2481DRAFT_454699 [Aureobasidium subglaciale EXF-2481]KEQ91839.1 hypothetical protein AUEXF2481DRAFT_454699 [Aureobasidium subglaciale EXF-2481]
MGRLPAARDCVDSTIPVFPIQQIDREVLNAFFEKANALCREYEYPEAQSTLMTSRDITAIRPRTESPVDDGLINDWPFQGLNVEQIMDFVIQHLDQTDLSPTNLVILDNRTNQDSTCLLLSRNELSDDPLAYIQVRSDFESAIVVLGTIEIGCGGADVQLSTEYPGSDGVLRVSMRDRT